MCQEGFPQPKKSDFSLKNSQGTEKLQISAHHQQNCTLIILSPMLVIVLYHDIITTQGKMFTVCDVCQHLILFLHGIKSVQRMMLVNCDETSGKK